MGEGGAQEDEGDAGQPEGREDRPGALRIGGGEGGEGAAEVRRRRSAGQDAASMVERQQLADLLKYSLIVISTAPVLLIYPFVAKHFTKGIMLGAVKG